MRYYDAGRPRILQVIKLNQTSSDNRAPRFLRNAAGLLIVLVFALGLFTLARWLFQFLARFNYGFLAPFGSWLHDAITHMDTWIAALATVFIGWATWMLRRSTEAQVAGNAPVLRYVLFREDANSPPLPNPHFYVPAWDQRDKSNPFLAGHLTGHPTYIRLQLYNDQSNATGVAFDLIVQVRLRWGAHDDVTPHPHEIVQKIEHPYIGAGKWADGRIFNVGDLENYVVDIIDVSYSDVRARKRRTSYGTGNIWQKVNGVPITSFETVFKPLKGEVPR